MQAWRCNFDQYIEDGEQENVVGHAFGGVHYGEEEHCARCLGFRVSHNALILHNALLQTH